MNKQVETDWRNVYYTALEIERINFEKLPVTKVIQSNELQVSLHLTKIKQFCQKII